MAKERGEIIEVSFQLKDHRDQIKNLSYPAIIISNDDVYNADSCYLCVMITHSPAKDCFTFELKNEMFVKPLYSGEDFIQARCHLVTYVYEEHITKNAARYNKMKSRAVDRLVEHIYQKSLSNVDL